MPTTNYYNSPFSMKQTMRTGAMDKPIFKPSPNKIMSYQFYPLPTLSHKRPLFTNTSCASSWLEHTVKATCETRLSHNHMFAVGSHHNRGEPAKKPMYIPSGLRTMDASVYCSDDQKISDMSELEKMRMGGFWFRKWRFDDVANLCWIVVIHVLAAFAPFVFDLGALFTAVGLATVTGLGMTVGYHRLLTHRSFKMPKWLEYVFVYCGILSGQKDPITWVSVHKSHHKYSETERDPHSPNEGFWFSHLGWFCYNDYVVAKCGEYTNVPELKAQSFYRFLHDTDFWHPIALGVVLYLYGGFPYLVWALGVRAVYACHMTFAVRSVGHIWGERSWNTPDTSTNNWLTGILAFGEGWHNNHHAFPSSARHGLEWWQFDLTWELIKFLEQIGLVTDVKLPTEADKARMAPSKFQQTKISYQD